MTVSALKALNEEWFSKLKTRWTDIVGSVAGKELFLVDGYSLIRHILDDPLLRLAKDDCECPIYLLYAVEYAELFTLILQPWIVSFCTPFLAQRLFSMN